MRTPRFWNEPRGWVASALMWMLAPFSWFYGAITAWRMGKIGQRVAVPVICIGNLTAGGAGKTPTVLKLAALLQAQGRNPIILSRGYGGSAHGPLLVDPAVHDASVCGDEPWMMAASAPVVVARDRVAGAALAIQAGADVILMDDGLQNPALIKDFVIAVVDGGVGFGNGHVVPAGPLRAPLLKQWPFVDAVLVIGADTRSVTDAILAAGKPLMTGRLKLDTSAVAAVAGKPLLAFAGIGRPEKFFTSLRDAGLDLRMTHSFGDHHMYRAAELAALRAQADAQALTLVTTQKDAARLHGLQNHGILALPVALELDDAAMMKLLAQVLKKPRSVP